MKVIGAGFGRTGTLSLKIALEELGFAPCYHMREVIVRPRHVRLWQAVADGEPVAWSQIFDGFQAGVDYPICNYYREIMEAYPEAKVILTVRDPERWYESTLHTIYRLTELFGYMHWLIPPLGRFAKMNNQMIWQELFDGRFTDKTHAIQLFNDHIAEVQRVVAPEKLLVFQVSEGWEPLCRFLDVPVPTEKPFPHVNDRAIIENMIRTLEVISVVLPVLLAASFVGIGVLLWRWLKGQAP